MNGVMYVYKYTDEVGRGSYLWDPGEGERQMEHKMGTQDIYFYL